MKQALVFFILFICCVFTTNAQIYPVTSNVIVSGSKLPYLNYYADQNNHLQIMLLLTDFNTGSQNVKLRLKLEHNNFKLQTNPNAVNLPTYTLEPGQPIIITGSDLLPYFTETNFPVTSGSLADRNNLPEGIYSLCVDVIKNGVNGEILSTNNCTQFFISPLLPPLLNLPFNQAEVDTNSIVNLMWSLPQNYTFDPSVELSYNLELARASNPVNIADFTILSNQVINITDIIDNQFTIIPSFHTAFIPGYTYIWRIKANLRDATTNQLLNIIQNNGISAPSSFVYGQPFSPLGNLANGLEINVNATPNGTRKGTANWIVSDNTPNEGLSDYSSYIIEYRKAQTNGATPFNWHSDTTTVKTLNIQQLEPSTTYEVRVSGRVNDYVSPPSNITTFTTPVATQYACNNANNPILPTNYSPLQQALIGDYIQIGQFELEITQVEAESTVGYYTGRGFVRHKFLNGAKCYVKFDNVKIDDQYVVREGFAEALTDGAAAWLHDQYLGLVDTIYQVNGVIEDQGFLNDSTVFVIVNGDTISFPMPNNNLPVIVHGANNVEIQFWPDGTIVVTTYGVTPSADSLDATADRNAQFSAPSGQEIYFDQKEYDHFASNYEMIACSGGYNYWVPNSSKTTTDSRQIKVNYHVKTGYSPTIVSFKIKEGATLTHTAVNDTTFLVTLPARTYDYQVYAMYGELKIGKLQVRSLDTITRNVQIIPLVSTAIDAQQLETAVNNIFKGAQVSLNVTVQPTFIAPEIDTAASWSNPETTLSEKYTAQMRSVRDAYLAANPEVDNSDYLIFIVPSFENPQIDGYMVRGRGLGFITSSTAQSSTSLSPTLAHELGHGMGGLQHAWGTDDSKKNTTNNLLDYQGGTKLIANQWQAIHDAPNVLNWFDGEEENSLLSIDLINLSSLKNGDGTYTFFAPNGRFITLPGSIKSIKIATLDRWGILNQTIETEPIGSLSGFTDENDINYAFSPEGRYYQTESLIDDQGNNYRRYIKEKPAYSDKLTSTLQPKDAITCFFSTFESINSNSRYVLSTYFKALSGINQTEYDTTKITQVIDKLIVFENDPNDRTLSRDSYIEKYRVKDYPSIELLSSYWNPVEDISIKYKTDTFALSEKSLLSIDLVDVNLSKNSPVNDFIKYFALITSKKTEFAGFSDCFETLNEEDLNNLIVYKENLISNFQQNLYLNSSKLSETKSTLEEFKIRTISELIKDALKIYNSDILNDLISQIKKGSAEQIHNWIYGHNKCVLSGLDVENRALAFNKLIKHQSFWKSLAPLLQNFPWELKQEQQKFLELTTESNSFDWINIASFQLQDYQGDVQNLNDLYRSLILLNNIIARNTDHELVKESQMSTEIVDPSNVWQTIGINYGTLDEAFFVSKSWTTENIKLENRDFEIFFNDGANSFNVSFINGSIRVKNHYSLKEVTTSFNSPNFEFPTEERNIDLYLKPYELVKIVFAESYPNLSINQGDVRIVPAYFLLFLQIDNQNDNFWNKVSIASDLFFITSDILTFYKGPFTFTGSMSAVNAILASANIYVTQQKIGMNAEELESLKTWDNFYMFASYASLAPNVTNLTKSSARLSLTIYDTKNLLKKLSYVTNYSKQIWKYIKGLFSGVFKVNGAGKLFNSIDEAVLSKIDDITKRVYRGDARVPEEIFENGFTCKGTNTDITDYVEMNIPSIFIGTSKSPQQALLKSYTSQSEGYVYVIGKKGQMTDVNNWYSSIEGYQNPYFSELEVVFENTIPKTNIQGAFRINSQGEVIGDLIPNPNYIP